MRTLFYTELPLTNDPRQVFTVDVVIDGIALHARMEIRYLSALDQWVISIWDNATSVLLVNQVPLICSYQYGQWGSSLLTTGKGSFQSCA